MGQFMKEFLQCRYSSDNVVNNDDDDDEKDDENYF